MTPSVYHIKAHLARLILDGVGFIEIFVQPAALDEPLGAHPQHELTAFICYLRRLSIMDDEQVAFSDKLALVDDAYQKLLNDDAEDLLSSAGLEDVKHTTATWADVYDTANHDERRAILQQFIKEIRVRKDYEISITLNASFNQVEQLKAVSTYDGAEIFEEISEKGA